MDFKNIFKTFFLGLVFVGICGFFVFSALFLFSDVNKENLSLASISESALVKYKPQRNWDMPDLDPYAVSSLAIDYNLTGEDKILLSKNAKAVLPIASLTKLMSAVIVLDSYNLEYVTTVSKEADKQYSVLQDISESDKLSLKNLLEIMLVASSNKSAYALAEVMGREKFVELMNAKAKYIGLENTSFFDPAGLSDKNQSTAEDLAKLAEYILNNYPQVSHITKLKQIDIPNEGQFNNTNELLAQLPDTAISKTGFTIEAKGCMLLVESNQKTQGYLIYVILGADDRSSVILSLINWTKSAYLW